MLNPIINAGLNVYIFKNIIDMFNGYIYNRDQLIVGDKWLISAGIQLLFKNMKC